MGLRKYKGFSLFEALLLLAIVSAMLVTFFMPNNRKTDDASVDKAVNQMQMILNAALSFYNINGRWPQPGGGDEGSGWRRLDGTFLNSVYIIPNPSNPVESPYDLYRVASDRNNFYISAPIVRAVPNQKATIAFLIANRLPNGRVANTYIPTIPFTVAQTCTSITSCQVTYPTAVGFVTVPGQNQNNARSVNFAGVYHSGACVPAPSCPTGMVPQIFVAPASVTGVNDRPTGCTSNTLDNPQCDVNVYPVSSFAAFARGTNTDGEPGASNTILDCTITTTPSVLDCNYPNTGDTTLGANPSTYPALDGTQQYWRVCLAIITQRGQVVPSSTDSYSGGNASAFQHGVLMGSVVAITRCAPGTTTSITEPTGSDFRVWSPNSNWVP